MQVIFLNKLVWPVLQIINVSQDSAVFKTQLATFILKNMQKNFLEFKTGFGKD